MIFPKILLAELLIDVDVEGYSIPVLVMVSYL